MDKIARRLKAYIDTPLFDPGDSDCKAVLDQLYQAYAESHESDPVEISEGFKELEEFLCVGTINMDHRSLVHNFENGVWLHRCDCIESIRRDFNDTFAKCVHIDESKTNWHWLRRFIRSVAKVFAPLM